MGKVKLFLSLQCVLFLGFCSKDVLGPFHWTSSSSKALLSVGDCQNQCSMGGGMMWKAPIQPPLQMSLFFIILSFTFGIFHI